MKYILFAALLPMLACTPSYYGRVVNNDPVLIEVKHKNMRNIGDFFKRTDEFCVESIVLKNSDSGTIWKYKFQPPPCKSINETIRVELAEFVWPGSENEHLELMIRTPEGHIIAAYLDVSM